MKNAIAKTILLVDDYSAFLDTLAVMIRSCSDDFCVLTAENGEGALKILKSAHVELVVTDLSMPVMDGFELISHVKEDYPSVLIIVISFFLYPEQEKRLKSMGVTSFLDKGSLNADALEEIIFSTLSGAECTHRDIP